MDRRNLPCFNCQEYGHISANCDNPWRNYRCLNCNRAWDHAESCTSQWFDLRAAFTACSNAEESAAFNRMEFQRQQLSFEIQRIREKRIITINPTQRHRMSVNMTVKRPAIDERANGGRNVENQEPSKDALELRQQK